MTTPAIRAAKQKEGADAFRAGVPVESNPYRRSQWISYFEWDSGWVNEQHKAEREALAAVKRDDASGVARLEPTP